MHTEITSLKLKTGTMGNGDPSFGAEMIPAAMRTGGRGIPCTMSDLGDFARSTLAAQEINADRVIEVPRRALTAIGVGDPLGARLVIQRLEPAPGTEGEQPSAETRDVVRASEKRTGANNILKLTLSPRRNVPGAGGAGGGS